ncbi:MAG: hypothetical protein ACFNQE_03900 [Capnocytophaga leadbetteri]
MPQRKKQEKSGAYEGGEIMAVKVNLLLRRMESMGWFLKKVP